MIVERYSIQRQKKLQSAPLPGTPGQAAPKGADPSQAKPSRMEPNRAYAHVSLGFFNWRIYWPEMCQGFWHSVSVHEKLWVYTIEE